MENDDGDFVFRDLANKERFTFSLSNETLFIRVHKAKEHLANFTFIADITEAELFRKWLADKLDG